MKKYFTLLGIFIFLFNYSVAQIPAFPGAEGWGAKSIGGRGGAVYEVVNLNDSGPGSFREACEMSGPRTVIFKTGGIIALQSEIQIINPYIYVAGQTAPGDGIVLKNFPLSIFTHDVIIRGLRIRVGDDLHFLSPDNKDCVTIQDGSYHVIIDHCSMSWATDENVSIWGPNVEKVTIQWCNISEALHRGIHPKGAHSMGLLVGNGASKISLHHNLLAHNGARNPMIVQNSDHEFMNNVVYDWLYKSDLLEQGTQFKLDYRGNYLKPFTYSSFPELPLGLDFDASTVFNSKLNMVNNYCSPANPFITSSQLAAMGANAAVFSQISLLSEPSTVTESSPFEAYQMVTNSAGALHPVRDFTDNRIIQTVLDSTGGLLDCIRATPIVLDSGFVIGATDSTIIYTMLGKPILYSAESRKIEIISGQGSGQVRYGAIETPTIIDLNNLIFESKITSTWTTVPNSSSYYKFYAGCQNNLSSYPMYNQGIGYVDSDHDGMPDDWELSNGLNPNNSNDGNGTNLSVIGYTNLEVYLNGYYSGNGSSVYEIENENQEKIIISPNPAHVIAEISYGTLIPEKMVVTNSYGTIFKVLNPNTNEFFRLNVADWYAGIYFLKFHVNGSIYTRKLVVVH